MYIVAFRKVFNVSPFIILIIIIIHQLINNCEKVLTIIWIAKKNKNKNIKK